MNSITCLSCKTENPANEIFCSSCGVRLPKSKPSQEDTPTENSSAGVDAPHLPPLFEKPQRKKKDSLTFANLLASLLISSAAVAPFAALSAAAILALRPPSDTPQKSPRDPHTSLVIEQQLKLVTHPTFQGSFSITQKQINSFLTTRLTPQQTIPLLGQNAMVIRQFIQLDSQAFSFGADVLLKNTPLTLRTKFSLTPIASSKELKPIAFFIGCLPIDPTIAQNLFPWYLPFAETYRPQLEALAIAKTIKISPKEVDASWAYQRPDIKSEPLLRSSSSSSPIQSLELKPSLPPAKP